MGVYIKGMEMPKPGAYTCELGVLDDNTAVLTIYTPINEPQKSYTLIQVPQHGRLIDLDETALAQYYDEEHEEWSMKTVTVEDILWEVCENMPPTVIPADEDGET